MKIGVTGYKCCNEAPLLDLTDARLSYQTQSRLCTVLLDEMVMNGYIVETNKGNILRPIDLMERESQKAESMYR